MSAHDEALIFQKMSAFRLFLKAGMDEAIATYPDLQHFIEENKDKTLDEVKAELKGLLATV